ncbi:MAG: glycoside hydrolase family 52 protein [Verrucomicrobiota bacterium]
MKNAQTLDTGHGAAPSTGAADIGERGNSLCCGEWRKVRAGVPSDSLSTAEATHAARRPPRLWLLWLLLAALGAGTLSATAFTMLSSNELVFVNVDHAPMGACSTLTYGLNGPIGPYYNIRGDWCGLGMSTASIPYFGGGGGVVIALSGSAGLQSLPFAASPGSIAVNASFFGDTNVHRTLTPCTDEWTIDNAGLAFTHYTPAWSMASLDTATLSDKKRFFLPATWLVLTVNNTNTTREDLYVGLPTAATRRSFANGAYQGFEVGEAALAVQSGRCDLLSGPSLTAALNGMTKGFAFHLSVPAGQTRTLVVVVAFYRSAAVDSRIAGSYYYTSLFGSVDSVIDSAFAGFADARMRCQQLASAMANAGLNVYRQFLACHALHSYMANTACLIDPSGGVHWRVTEGHYNYINTFDLTVDLAFYDSQMHPWALRNVLDTFSGALPGAGYSFDHPLYDAASGAVVSSHGFSFHHDMGNWPTSNAPGTDPTFDDYMGQEQLENWILSAGLYWSHSGDHAWLTNNLALLQTCLNSMLLRDDPNADARNGITKYLNRPEGTTFDDLDDSLRTPRFSGRMTVRNWACYLALQAMFGQIGDAPDAATCQSMAAAAAQTIVDRWNSYRGTLGYIPALLDGSDQSAIIPMVEGLAYPAQMGLTNAVDRTGPYASMLLALSNHLAAVLVPGRCLNATSGAWDMTSATDYINPHNTWQSKMYIAQYVAEQVLGLSGSNVNGTVDQIHATIQIQNAPFHEWSDQTDGTGADRFLGSCHYPRGITSALWWLNAANNPAYPVPTSAPEAPSGLSALAGDRQAVLFWNGAALARGYNLKRATVSGGPYTPAASGVTGASFTDPGLVNGITYYYVVTATNQIGEGLPSPEASATPYGPVPSTGTNITVLVNGGNLTVSWPSNYVGWILQTNTVDVGNNVLWGDLPGSQTDRQMTFPTINPTIPMEFFRLRHP